MFNLCLAQGIFPDSFKIAQVIPLFKGGTRESPDSYRPISLLPAIGKVFEKIIANRITHFFDRYKLFSPCQLGFRAKLSTEYAVQDIYEKLLHNMDQSLSSCAIFLDLAKAFDTVDRSILLRKLQAYGIRGNVFKLLQSYLSGRSQFVKLDGVYSSTVQIEYGVPQGSILGPLLFLIYVNDLPSATKFFIKLFADDTFLCAQNKNMKALENEVNFELGKVFVWLASNKLTLNMSKSKFMILTNARKNVHEISVKINRTPLEKCTKYKYLGIVIDEKLNWKDHVDYVCKKVSKACGILAKIRHCASVELQRDIYYALFYSYIRYGITIWGNACETTLSPLQTLLHRAARIMTFAPFGRIDILPLLNYLEILDIKDIFRLETAKLIFKVKNDMIPIPLKNYFETRTNAAHGYNLRRRQETAQPMIYRTSYALKTIQYKVPFIWKDIPQNIQVCETLMSFKKQLKLYLLQMQGIEDSNSLQTMVRT